MATTTGGTATAASRPAALYVKRNSIYRQFGFDVWDRARDATTYDGPGPVIAHPPCGHWGVFHKTCKQPGKECAPIAVEQVRRLGGILEHPSSSRLFKHTACPVAEGQRDLHGGQIIRINQCDYGFRCVKPTTLYIVGLNGRPKLLPKNRPAHIIDYNDLGSAERSRTPCRMVLLMICLISQLAAVRGAE